MSAFASNLGMGAPQLIAAAMAQRGYTDPSSPISQVSPASPSFRPATADTAQLPIPTPSSAMPPQMGQNAPPMRLQGPNQPIMPQSTPQPQEKLPMTQDNIIIQSLIKQLERNHQQRQISSPPRL